MTPRAFCQSGKCEPVKLAVHALMGAGAVGCAGYNWTAFYYRGERHNLINALVYTALVALEIAHVRHHADSAA